MTWTGDVCNVTSLGLGYRYDMPVCMFSFLSRGKFSAKVNENGIQKTHKKLDQCSTIEEDYIEKV